MDGCISCHNWLRIAITRCRCNAKPGTDDAVSTVVITRGRSFLVPENALACGDSPNKPGRHGDRHFLVKDHRTSWAQSRTASRLLTAHDTGNMADTAYLTNVSSAEPCSTQTDHRRRTVMPAVLAPRPPRATGMWPQKNTPKQLWSSLRLAERPAIAK